MPVRVISDRDGEHAALYCSTTMFAFGPVIERGPDGETAEQMADQFLEWHERVAGTDPRTVSTRLLEDRYQRWLKQRNQPPRYARVADGWDDETGTTALQRMMLEGGR